MFRPIILVMLVLTVVAAKKSAPNEKPKWAQKDIRDYSEADLERLLDQWEVGILYIIIAMFKNNLDKKKVITLHRTMRLCVHR